jgi:hypothetical protein
MKDVVGLMHREGLNAELLGRSKQLRDTMSRLQADDPDSGNNEKERQKFTRQVNDTYPEGYVWEHL